MLGHTMPEVCCSVTSGGVILSQGLYPLGGLDKNLAKSLGVCTGNQWVHAPHNCVEVGPPLFIC